MHLGVMHDPRASAAEHHSWNVAGFSKLLEYVAQFHVPKLVVLSSANVYGPQPSNPQFLTEDAPLLGGQNFSDIRDLVEVDMLAQSFFWKLPETETVILRPVHILGRVHNAPSNFLRLNPVLTVMGFDPMTQVHPPGRRGARHRAGAVAPAIRGIFNIAGPRAGAALAAHQAPRAPAAQRALLPRAHRPPPPVVAAPHDLPAARARSHPLRVHGRRPPRAAGAGFHAPQSRSKRRCAPWTRGAGRRCVSARASSSR